MCYLYPIINTKMNSLIGIKGFFSVIRDGIITTDSERRYVMHPILLSISGFEIKTAYVLWLLSSVVFMLWTRRRGEVRYSQNPAALSYAVLASYLAAVAGALVFGALESGQSFLSQAAWRGDLSSSGGILLGTAAGLAAVKKKNISFGRFFDAAAVPAAVSIGIWRLGCLAEGCCRGVRAAEHTCLTLSYPGEAFARNAYTAEEALYVFLCSAVLAAAERYFLSERECGRGAVAGLGLIMYSVFRLLIDPLREEGLGPWGYAAFIILALTGTVLVIRAYKKRDGHPAK